MAGFSNRNLSKTQSEIHLIDYVEPKWVVRVYSPGGQARNYRIATANDVDGPYTDLPDQWFALAGTVALTNGNATVAGTLTSFDTELAVGDTVCLADGKVLGRVATITSATAIELDANWAGASTGPGATLYLATPQNRELPRGQTSETHILPLDLNGTPLANRKYLFIEAVDSPISYDLSVPGTGRVFPVRDSFAQQSV